ncbi:hypothetical protein L0991_03710 [Vibrio chagasii]|uniref:hypothetical protein n=1 Tax=Vibrio chagasii TaxID=170679 RepID=UPI0035A619BA
MNNADLLRAQITDSKPIDLKQLRKTVGKDAALTDNTKNPKKNKPLDPETSTAKNFNPAYMKVGLNNVPIEIKILLEELKEKEKLIKEKEKSLKLTTKEQVYISGVEKECRRLIRAADKKIEKLYGKNYNSKD